MKTADRVLAILRLFSIDRPEWTVESAAHVLGLSQSTAYEYFRSLVDSGLIVTSKAGRYVIGPAIIEYDRLTRTCDPLIANAEPLLKALTDEAPASSVGLLCRLYRLRVMCVDQYVAKPVDFAVSYERGRPMPLFRGSASKIILAHMPLRKLKRDYDQLAFEAAQAGMGQDWASFRTSLRRIRTGEVCVTRGELDRGRIGISAPVFALEGDILGSIGLVVAESATTAELLKGLELRVAQAGRDLSARLGAGDSAALARAVA